MPRLRGRSFNAVFESLRVAELERPWPDCYIITCTRFHGKSTSISDVVKYWNRILRREESNNRTDQKEKRKTEDDGEKFRRKMQTMDDVGGCYLGSVMCRNWLRILLLNQKQVNSLGVAKDLGDSVGVFAGLFSEYLPTPCLLLVGGIHNLIGYGWLWLLVTGRVPILPFWMVCLSIFVGTNGETYFNTAALVSSAQTFPMERGSVVGILKGFAGLSGAIFSQIYAALYEPDQAAFIFIVAVGPFMVATALTFLLQPVPPQNQKLQNPGDAVRFHFIYTLCALIAAHLLGIMIVQDLVQLSRRVIYLLTFVLLVILCLPLCLPLEAAVNGRQISGIAEPLLEEDEEKQLKIKQKQKQKPNTPVDELNEPNEATVSKSNETSSSSLSPSSNEVETIKKTLWERFQSKCCRGFFSRDMTIAESKMNKTKSKVLGKNHSFREGLLSGDMWLLFLALVCVGGSGLTIIDNLGQITEAKGYANPHIFVSMISIWNFLGRIGGGYLSEVLARDFHLPRPLTIAVAQGLMAIGQLVFSTYLPGSLYAGTLLVGLGYGAHCSIVPATATDFFGLRNFGSFYNFLTLANPVGSVFFSGVIAGTLYDLEAAKQAQNRHGLGLLRDDNGNAFQKCHGRLCFFWTHMIMTVFCILGMGMSLYLSYRTRDLYYDRLYQAKGKRKAKQERTDSSSTVPAPKLAPGEHAQHS